MRVFLVQIVLGKINQTVLVIEVLVDLSNFNAQIAALGLKMRLNVQQQYLIELSHCLGCPVILAHEDFTGPLLVLAIGGTFSFVTKAFGQSMLQIEDQSIFSSLGQQVQACTNQAQDRFVAFDLFNFQWRRQTFFCQVIPTFAQACGLRNPQNNLQISQSTR